MNTPIDPKFRQTPYAFLAKLSDKAKALIESPVKEVDTKHFVGYQAGALFPIKDWYQEKFAEVFNLMVENGDVYDIVDVVIQRITAGGRATLEENGKPYDLYLGPDKYAVMHVGCHSKLSIAELENKYGLRGHFAKEGLIAPHYPTWFSFAMAEHERNKKKEE